MKARAVVTAVGVLVTLAILSNLVVRESRANYDSEGNAQIPLLCPSSLPTTAPEWQVNLMPITFRVPKATWDPYKSGTGGWTSLASRVPFSVSSMGLTPNIQPVMAGQAWYQPGQTQTTYEGTEYRWEGPSALTPPGAFALCFRREWLWGLIWNNYIYFPGDPLHIYGYAFPLDVGDDGGGGCGGGSGGDDDDEEDEMYRVGPAGADVSDTTTASDPIVQFCGGGSGSNPEIECWDEWIEIQIQFEGDPTWYTIWNGYASVCDFAE
jgi:hypothetical protein